MGLIRNALLNPYLSVVALLSYAVSGRHAAGAGLLLEVIDAETPLAAHGRARFALLVATGADPRHALEEAGR